MPSHPHLDWSRFLPTEIAPITQLHVHGEMGWSPMDRPNLTIPQGPPGSKRLRNISLGIVNGRLELWSWMHQDLVKHPHSARFPLLQDGTRNVLTSTFPCSTESLGAQRMGLWIRRTGASRATRMQGLAKLETISRQSGRAWQV